MASVKLIFGSGLLTKSHGCSSVESAKPWLNALLETKDLASEIDTSSLYHEAEGYLGQLDFGSHFAIGTKLPGITNQTQPATRDAVIAQTMQSLERLNLDQVDLLCMHTPDVRVSFEDTLSGFDALYKDGKFKRFGLSNYKPEQVEEVIEICKEKGFVFPSVFVGNYNAFARLAEDQLLPLLRKHNISFYAYSPIAGGFLAKSTQQFRDDSFEGRWHKETFLGKCYHYQYDRPHYLEALDKWHKIAEDEGILPVEMAYRWIAHNSALDGSWGDGIVIGASTIDQWKSTLAGIQKGPLSAETAAKIDALWPPLKGDSVYSNLEVVMAVMSPPKQK